MTVYDVVVKLIGPIQPVGETNEDNRRLQNAKVMTKLVESLLWDISRAAENSGRPEYSMKAIGAHCEEFLKTVHEDTGHD